MKRQSFNPWLVLCAVALLGITLLPAIEAQEPNSRYEAGGESTGAAGTSGELFDPGDRRPTRTGQRTKVQAYGRYGSAMGGMSLDSPFGGGMMSGMPRSMELGPQIHKAVEALRDAEGKRAQEQAHDVLYELLTKYFNDDMERRENELESMEARLEKLRKQLDERSDKRDEIVDLQIKVLVNQANGLGFFSNGQSEAAPGNPWFFQGQPATYTPTPSISVTPPRVSVGTPVLSVAPRVPAAAPAPASPAPTPAPPAPAVAPTPPTDPAAEEPPRPREASSAAPSTEPAIEEEPF